MILLAAFGLPDEVVGIVVGLGLAIIVFFLLRLPSNQLPDEFEEDENDPEDEGEDVEYDAAGPDPWEAELGATEPLRDIDTLIDVLRTGEPGPCRKAVEDLVSHGPQALPALRAATEEGDPDLRIDAQRAIALIEEETDP